MKPLLLVAGVSLLLRLAAWGYLEQRVAAEPGRLHVVAGDAGGYWDLGTDIAAGREYAVHQPPRRAMRTPGVPLIVAGSVAAFGESRTAARGVLAAVSALAPVGVFLTAGVWFAPRVAAAAGLLAAAAPLAVGLSPTILSDGPFAASLSLVCWRLAVLLRTPSRAAAAAAGLAAGASCLIRPALLPAVPVLAAVAALAVRDRWCGVVLAAVAAGVLAPWAVRNGLVAGRFTPTTLWTGPTLYDSFRPGSDGGSDMRFFDADADARRGMSEAGVDRWYAARAWAAVRADPAAAAGLAVRKQARFWALLPRAAEAGPPAFGWACAAWSVAVWALAAAGLVRHRRHWRLLLVAAGPLLYLAALHLVFVGSMRYRMPGELPLCVLAAAAWAATPPRAAAPPRGT